MLHMGSEGWEVLLAVLWVRARQGVEEEFRVNTAVALSGGGR